MKISVVKSLNTDFYHSMLIAVTFILLSIFCHSTAYAEPRVYSGITTSITIDKFCKEKPDNSEIILVFNGEKESSSSGWFFGKGTSTAEFKRITPTRFEVTYAVTRYNKLPPSYMELLPSKDGFHAVISDHITEDRALRESTCFFEKMEVYLKPTKGSADNTIMQAKALSTSELIMIEGQDLLLNKKDFPGADSQGRKSLAILEPVFGKLSKETLQSAGLIVWALIEQSRFDEALEIITPYRKAMPDDKVLKELEEVLEEEIKEQNELFKSDPDSKSGINLKPLA